MNIGIIKETICVNVAVFDSIQTAETFAANGHLGDADTIAELPDDFGIGDIYADGVWSKAITIAQMKWVVMAMKW